MDTHFEFRTKQQQTLLRLSQSVFFLQFFLFTNLIEDSLKYLPLKFQVKTGIRFSFIFFCDGT